MWKKKISSVHLPTHRHTVGGGGVKGQWSMNAAQVVTFDFTWTTLTTFSNSCFYVTDFFGRCRGWFIVITFIVIIIIFLWQYRSWYLVNNYLLNPVNPNLWVVDLYCAIRKMIQIDFKLWFIYCMFLDGGKTWRIKPHTTENMKKKYTDLHPVRQKH